MRRLAIFLPSLGGGGAERVMLTLAPRLAERGVQCDLVTAIHGGDLIGQAPKGIRLIELGRGKTIHALVPLFQYLRREKPDVLLSTIFSANICALLASTMALRKHRTVIRESCPSEVNVKAWPNRIAATALYRSASQIIAISQGVKGSLIANRLADPSRVRVIYNPVGISRYPSDSTPRSKSLILACGRLEEVKDYPTLIRAFARVRQHHDVRLRVLGEGTLRETLTRQCHNLGIMDYVSFDGFVHDPAKHMREAAVFVHSASSEGFGLALAEALASGCPVVATDSTGGVREVLDGGKYGILVPVGDDAALAAAILSALRNEADLADPSEHLRKFDIEHVTDQYMDVLFRQL